MIAAPRVKFRDVVELNLRPFTLAHDQNADLVGMRLYGGGPFHREHKQADKIRKKSHFIIRTGDVIFNKLFAWKGAFGIVPSELDGMYVSDKFPTYVLDTERVHPSYLKWYFRHPDIWIQAKLKSTGSAAISKLTLNPPQFLELDLPLPDLAEQVRITTKLDNIDRRMAEANALFDDLKVGANGLIQSSVDRAFRNLDVSGVLGDVLLEKPRNGWSPKCDNDAGGTPVLTLTAVTGWDFDPTAIKRTSLPTDPDSHYWLSENDLLITRSNTPELVGHVAIYNGNPSPCIYPDLIMRLRPDEARFSKNFIWWWMQSGAVREYIRTNAKGSSPTMKKISQTIVCSIPFPTDANSETQNDIVSKLNKLRSNIESCRRISLDFNGIAGELMPSILDKAFKGQL